jgi:hypothetical protein
MKFKVIVGSETYTKLLAIHEKGNIYKQQADTLAESLGAHDYCSGRGAYGGIRALCFKEKPEGYKLLQAPDFYYPKSIKKNDAVLEAIAKLPQVTNEELCEPLGFKRQSFSFEGNIYMTSRPGVDFGGDYILLDVPEGAKFQAGPDVVEILESEYLALQGK